MPARCIIACIFVNLRSLPRPWEQLRSDLQILISMMLEKSNKLKLACPCRHLTLPSSRHIFLSRSVGVPGFPYKSRGGGAMKMGGATCAVVSKPSVCKRHSFWAFPRSSIHLPSTPDNRKCKVFSQATVSSSRNQRPCRSPSSDLASKRRSWFYISVAHFATLKKVLGF